MGEPDSLLDALVAAVRQSTRYRTVAPELIRQIGARELKKRTGLKEAVGATRRKLHQVAGAYLPPRTACAVWIEELRRAFQSGDGPSVRAACVHVMARHASTRERLPILDRFHAIALEPIAPVRSVLDVACGLHPLSLPWMPLAEGVVYHAWDVFEDLIALLNDFFALAGVAGHAELRDALAEGSTPEVELALLLKTLPCLEQIDAAATHRLLDTLPARHLLVSFPAQSLCGRRKGMPATYAAHFMRLASGRPWRIRRFDFPGELAFLVTKE